MSKTIDWYARSYCKNFNFHIVPIEPLRKNPRTADWGERAISDPEIAAAYYAQHPDWNMGLALGPSRMCSLDIDDHKSLQIICDALGVDLQAVIDSTPTIRGRGLRVMFRVPEGAQLGYHKLNWRPESDPTGEVYREIQAQAREAKANGDDALEADLREQAKQHAPYTVFELRSSCDGKQRQDVLPPSIHPDTRKPYTWETQPQRDWPKPPEWLLTIWREFDKIKPQLLAACPWVDIETVYRPATKTDARPRVQYAGSNGGLVSVVNAYNEQTSIESTLAGYGYEQRGARFLAPSSSTKLPGVVLLPNSNKAWIHHASDPLCSDDTGQPVSPFDLYCYYEHGGDFKAAAQSLAQSLGLRTDTPSYTPLPDMPPVIDPETGEVLAATTPNVPPVPQPTQRKGVDYITPLPWTNHLGKPKRHHDNLAEILRRLGVTVRYNVINKAQQILIPGEAYTQDNADNAAVAWVMSECSIFDFSTDHIDGSLTLLSERNLYNPVVTWIESKPWDGIERFRFLVESVRAQEGFCEDLKNTLIYRWMLSAIAAAYSPNGVMARGVLVFQGQQSMGKTTWFKKLVPEHLDVIQDGLILDPKDTDSVKQAVSNWLVELGELDATFKKSDIAQLKGFLSRSRDTMRLPYAKRESKFARRTVFFGSVNPTEFLNDPTGATRFWTIPCDALDLDHGLDMQQVWAEIKHHHDQGETHHLTDEETNALNLVNAAHLAIDPVDEQLLAGLDWDAHESTWRWIQVTDALLDIGIDRPTKADAMRAAITIREHNQGRSKRIRGKRLLFVPPKVQTNSW